MPTMPPRPCRQAGCPRTSTTGFCPDHARTYDRRRGTARERGYTSRWDRYRRTYLRAHPLCVACTGQGRTTAATVVDHITPHKGNDTLFWDERNHRALCKPCHDRRVDEGDFGRLA